jgi:pimeloyl-ACP methyl ester carboxylesterase
MSERNKYARRRFWGAKCSKWMVWGKYDPSFDISEPESQHEDVPNAQVRILDSGHFALDTAADQIGDFGSRLSGFYPLRRANRNRAPVDNAPARRYCAIR